MITTDLHGTFYVAMNNDSLYIAAEILDNVVDAVEVAGGPLMLSRFVSACMIREDQSTSG